MENVSFDKFFSFSIAEKVQFVMNFYSAEFSKNDFDLIVKDWYTQLLKKLEDDYETLNNIQDTCEALFDVDKNKALCLMINLDKYANESRAHDINDSIAIWLEAEGGLPQLECIETLLAEADDSSSRKRYTLFKQIISQNHLNHT